MKTTEFITVKPGLLFIKPMLKQLLPTIEEALFFAKLHELNAQQLSKLLAELFNTPLVLALCGEGDTHSRELQDYLVDVLPPYVLEQVVFSPEAPPAPELLAYLFEEAQVEVAKSIADVAAKLIALFERMPGKEGRMALHQLRTLNKQRAQLSATVSVGVQHTPHAPNLVILDVSGSMTESTIRTIISDVVALGWKADASLAIVSNNTFCWEPGAYDVPSVLARAEYGGTHYETLTPLFDRNWGTVVTIADYDSSLAAAEFLRTNCKGSIEQVLDVSLVPRPTFLAECLRPLAKQVRPLMIAAGYL